MMSRPPGTRDDTEIRACCEAFAAGKTQKQLAEQFGVTQPTISYWLHTHGKKHLGAKFKVRKQGRPKLHQPTDRDKDILLSIAAGTRYADIASKYGITSSRVGAICALWLKRGYRVSAS